MQGFKPILSSKTIRAVLIAAVALLTSLGIDVFTPADAERLVTAIEGTTQPAPGGGFDAMSAVKLASEIIALVSLFVAYRGRVNATEMLVTTNEYRSMRSTGTALLIVGLTMVGLTSGGCAFMQTAEHITFREGVSAGVSTTFAEHAEFSSVIAGDNNRDGKVTAEDGAIDLTRLPNLSVLPVEARNGWLQARLLPQRETQRLIAEDRRRTSGN